MAGLPYGWKLDLTGGATVDRDASLVFSGVASLKYANPDNASNSGWHGIQTSDPLIGDMCLALRPGATYRIKVATQTNRIAGGQQYRIKAQFDAAGTNTLNKVFTYRVLSQWQLDEWTVTVPLTAERHSTLYVEFSRNGDATATNFWIDSVRIVEQEVGDLAGSEIANSGREDVILNGDFENKLAWWGDLDKVLGFTGDGAMSIDGSTAAAGAWSLKLTGTNTWAARTFQVSDIGDTQRGKELLVRVFPGDKLRVSASCKLSAAANLNGQMHIRMYKGDKTLDTDSTQAGLTWTTEVVFTAKEDTVNLAGIASIYYIGISLAGGGTVTGSVWWDEVHLWRMKRTADLWPNAIDSLRLSQVASIRQGDLGDVTGATNLSWGSSLNYKCRLTGNVTFTFNTSPPDDGAVCVLRAKQDGTGTRTITWPAGVHWDAGTAPAPNTGANKIAIYTFYYEASVWYGTMLGGNYS